MNTRKELGNLYNEYYSKGIGIEIGVQRGWNLKQICSQWRGKVLGLDTWTDNEIYLDALTNLEGCNKILIKADSVIFSEVIKDEALDWVYIDADHSYSSVRADFNAWHKKIRYGGVISFHDYGDNGFGVKTFIDELIKDNPDINMNFTTDDFWEGKEYQTAWFIRRKTINGF